MLTLLPPFRATSMQALAQKVIRGFYEKLSNAFSSDMRSLIKNLLQTNPKLRPTCDEILSTPGLLNHLTGTLENLEI